MISERATSARTLNAHAARFAWPLWILSAALGALGSVFLILNHAAPHGMTSPFSGSQVTGGVMYAAIGALIATRRRENPIGWLFVGLGVLSGSVGFAAEYGVYALATDPGALPGGVVMAWLSAWAWPAVFFATTVAFLLFPDGRLPGRRWRVVAWLAAVAGAGLMISFALTPGPLMSAPFDALYAANPFGIEGAGFLGRTAAFWYPLAGAAGLASILAVALRFRSARGIERQQLKWFTYAAALGAVVVVLDQLSPGLAVGPFAVMGIVGNLLMPVAIGIAILRYRLWDIDLIINRTLVYIALTVCVVGIYVLVVGYLGALFQREGNLAVSLIATGLVAVLFAPLRDRLQRAVNRMMYGERDDPYAVLSRLGERLEAALAPDAALPAAVSTVRDALKLPYAAVEVVRGGSFETVATAGETPADPLKIPLVYGGETIGRLALGTRIGEEGFTAADRKLLDDLTRQIGVAVHAARLTDEAVRLSSDLQKSRERLVTAREEERRRLRRDLHDGLGPQLAGLTMKAEAARDLLAEDPARASALLESLMDQAQESVADIRRLVYALRPPALDALGLLGALRTHAAHQNGGNPNVTIEAPEELPPLPAAVEVAAYRIVLEAVNNVLRHANAKNCAVEISSSYTALRLEVSDDGEGIPPDFHPGVGLHSMRERAEELGGSVEVEASPSGGTRVLATLPLRSGQLAKPGVERNLSADKPVP